MSIEQVIPQGLDQHPVVRARADRTDTPDAPVGADAPTETTAILEAIDATPPTETVPMSVALQQVVDDLRPHAAAVRAAPLDVRLGLLGAAVFQLAAWFEWWHGVARVQSHVSFSAVGSGTAFSDWRGWLGVLCMLTALADGIWTAVRGATDASVKTAAVASVGALVCVVWFWTSYSAAAGFSEGFSISIAAGFGLYLGLAAAATATTGTVRVWRAWRAAAADSSDPQDAVED